MSDYIGLRDEFLRLLTTDSETKDARKREFNQAIFFPEDDPARGAAIFEGTSLDMVMRKYDRAVKNMERAGR